MKKFVVSLLLTLSMPCALANAAPPGGTTESPSSLSIPKANWVPIFFESINERLALSDLSPLQNTVLPRGDLEVRVWEGFGEDGFKGYLLRRRQGGWSALELLPACTKDTGKKRQRILPTPESGWVSFWSNIKAKGLLTLPDDSTIPNRKPVLDGTCYVVEILNGGQYRAYFYNNPAYQTSPQDKQMVAISKLLHEEFKIGTAIFYP